jgi:hypothetical protein
VHDVQKLNTGVDIESLVHILLKLSGGTSIENTYLHRNGHRGSDLWWRILRKSVSNFSFELVLHLLLDSAIGLQQVTKKPFGIDR